MYNQLTESDIKKMEAEIEHRKLVVRKAAIEAVKEARAQGDLSENFEYYAAKREKNQNESRIRYLERMIKTARIVKDKTKENEVGMNSLVDLYFEEDDCVERYKIVTTVRGDTLGHKISIESPLGKAIYGKKLNERIFVKVREDYGFYVVIQGIDKSEGDEQDQIRKY